MASAGAGGSAGGAAAAATGVIFLAGALLNAQVSKWSTDDAYWYDCYNHYFDIPEEYTLSIDELLSDSEHSRLGDRQFRGNKVYPGLGHHRYYHYSTSERHYISTNQIGLIKIREIVDNREIMHYRAVVSPMSWGAFVFSEFSKKLISSDGNTVKVINIDTGSHTPFLFTLSEFLTAPSPRQQHAVSIIMRHWNARTNFNNKVMISGSRGLGKTYTGKVLKKEIERNFPNVNVRLYTDFNPTSIGVNIKNMALKYASAHTPVILIIDEIDVIYKKVMTPEQSFDPRIQHSRDKQTFNQMLDSLGAVPYVITIFTTEKDPETLRHERDEFASFMRPGRLDYIIKFRGDDNEAEYIENHL